MPFYPQARMHLPAQNYLGRRTYFVTICTYDRHPAFRDRETGRRIVAHLRSAAEKDGFALHAFCVMPDHVHLLAEGRGDRCDLLKFVDGFKQRSAYEYRRVWRGTLWQRRFHDYILRRSDPIEGVALYIWMNPVRKGLCPRAKDYPFSGSETIEWMSGLRNDGDWTPPWRAAIGAAQQQRTAAGGS